MQYHKKESEKLPDLKKYIAYLLENRVGYMHYILLHAAVTYTLTALALLCYTDLVLNFNVRRYLF